MGNRAIILADSISPDGVRLTTFEITVARIVLAEFNTHRVFSRNSASSRAIPVKKMIARVLEDPYIPSSWGKNQKGMQAGDDMTLAEAAIETAAWLEERDYMVRRAQERIERGVHKQLTNRPLETYMWHTIIVTATEWANFFHLRCNPMAHPDIQAPARMMRELYESNEPQQLQHGEWHLPLIHAEDRAQVDDAETLRKVSSARCARVSYLTHEGKRDMGADIELHDKLLTSGHMSPFEHVARPFNVDTDAELDFVIPSTLRMPHVQAADVWFGNFCGWVQYRKLIPGEADILAGS